MAKLNAIQQSGHETTIGTIPEVLRIERLLGAALALADVHEAGGANHGVMVEQFLSSVQLSAGAPWCAAFVAYLGYRSQLDLVMQRSDWPLPMTGSCAHLGEFARRYDILLETPVRGDIFLLYNVALGRFAHTGIVLDVLETARNYTCTTVEGNTNDDGSREGTKSCIKIRSFKKNGDHRFIHWTTLTQNSAATAADATRKAA